MKDKIKIKEISAGLSGVIPVAAFENLRPSYNMVVEPIGDVDPNEVFDYIERILHDRFEHEVNRAKIDLIEKQYSHIRFREKDGKKYPSVTSITGWFKEWKITDDELKQYAARGTIVHKLIEVYLTTHKWVEPYDIGELREFISILMSGSLGFSWTDCSYKAFIEKYEDKIEIEKTEQVVFNDQHLYSGRYDIRGKFDGLKAIMDFKTGVHDMRQLAAYAVCEKGIERLVILPVGPTDNKCGYKKPVICDTIQDEFKGFLKLRNKFMERFGV